VEIECNFRALLVMLLRNPIFYFFVVANHSIFNICTRCDMPQST
jgi:hypothetical protein